MKNTQLTVRCGTCGKEFRRKKGHAKAINYCSAPCANEGKRKAAYQRMCDLIGGDFKEWLKVEYTDKQRPIRDIARELYKNEKCSSSVLGWLERLGIDTRDRSEAIRLQWVNNDERRKNASDGMKKRITPDVRKKIYRAMLTDDYREKQRISKTGERNGMYGVYGADHPQWNPERTRDQRVKERKTFEYANWRKGVFARDNYTCQSCGDGKGGNLVAHHIESYSSNKAARYNIDNGVTLCKCCHLAYHAAHGLKDATRAKYEQFMKGRESETA